MEFEVISNTFDNSTNENDATIPHLNTSYAAPRIGEYSTFRYYENNNPKCNEFTSGESNESLAENLNTAHIPAHVGEVGGETVVRLKRVETPEVVQSEALPLTNADVIRTICKENVPGWTSFDDTSITVERILSGLTNKLFKVHVGKHLPGARQLRSKIVLFRVYGNNISKLYDSEFEIEVFKTLGRYNIAPKLIAQFKGGRIEEWVNGVPLTVRHLRNPSVTSAIASILGRFHKLHTERVDFPFSRSKGSTLFTKIIEWKNLVFDSSNITVEPSIMKQLDEMCIAKDAEILQQIVLSNCIYITPAVRLVFCHNDIQENNILMVNNNIRLIDFEYTNFNYAGFDLANLWIEAMLDYTTEEDPFYTVDYQNYPCEEHRRLFAAIYLSEVLNQPVLPSAPLIKPFLLEVELLGLASHMFWGLWSFIRNPPMEEKDGFDYVKYGLTRLKMYSDLKQDLISRRIIQEEGLN